MASKELIEKVAQAQDKVSEWPAKTYRNRHANEALIAIKDTCIDPTNEMINAALKVDFDNEDERATVINIWHAMLNASALGEQSE